MWEAAQDVKRSCRVSDDHIRMSDDHIRMPDDRAGCQTIVQDIERSYRKPEDRTERGAGSKRAPQSLSFIKLPPIGRSADRRGKRR